MAGIYRILDIFFVVFHSFLILFNLFGWILRKTRIWNLLTLLLTGASWTLLGFVVGTLGYCPLTDWHFRVLERLGERNLPDSYVMYLIKRTTRIETDSILVDKLTLYFFLAALFVSVILNLADYRKRKKKPLFNDR